MKKKMNLPLFNIESIINENIMKNSKSKNIIKKLKNINIIQTQTKNEKGYKEIMKRKNELKHSSILFNYNYNNNINNNQSLKNNNQNKYILVNKPKFSNSGYRDNFNLNNYTSNKRKKINQTTKLMDINQTFSEISLIEEISTTDKKNIKNNLKDNSSDLYILNNDKNNSKNEPLISINNLDSNSPIHKATHKNKIKDKHKNMIYNDQLKTINKIYSYINITNANKNKYANKNNNKKIFINIFNSKYFEDNKKSLITDRYSNNIKKNKNYENKIIKGINKTFNSINLSKSKSKEKSNNKKGNKLYNNIHKLKSSISFYNKIEKFDNKLFYNKIKKKKNHKTSSMLKWNYIKNLEEKRNSFNLKNDKSNISNSRNNFGINDLSIKKNKSLNTNNNSNKNNKIYKRQKSDLKLFKSDFNIKKKKKYKSINIFSNNKIISKKVFSPINKAIEINKKGNRNDINTENKNKFYNEKIKGIKNKNSKKNKNYMNFIKYCKSYLNEDKKSIGKKNKNLFVSLLNLNNNSFNKRLKIVKIKSSNCIQNKFKSTDYTSESKSKSKSKRLETEDKNKLNTSILKKKRNFIFKNQNSGYSHIFDYSFLYKIKSKNSSHNHSALNIITSTDINKNLNNSSAIINITNPYNNNLKTSNFLFNNYNINLVKSSNNSIYSFRDNSKSLHKTIENNINNDDKDGNYIIKKGELIMKRYEIISILGKGSFGLCCKCYDKENNEYVCIKILKNLPNSNELSQQEINILNSLNSERIQQSGHFVIMKDNFTFRGHICIVFELLSINLYEEIQNSNYVGFDLSTILKFSIQLLFGLLILKNKNIIHCDLKPENILLIKKGKTGIKIIDFGSACNINQTQYIYIQSRYYRAPEIILGLDYGYEIDMWSLGCILCELYCGIPIFPGENEYDMLYYIMEYIGIPPKELIDNSPKKLEFFNEDGSPLEKKNSLGKIRRPNKKSIEAFLINADKDFIDLIQNILKWNKDERFKPEDALKHNFIIKNLNKEGLELHYLKIKEFSSPDFDINNYKATITKKLTSF